MLQATESVYLSALSPKDSRWDDKRSQADGFKALYQGTKYNCYAVRIADCSCHLLFAFRVDDTGLSKLKLQAAKFCRVRLCPVCQDRRSLKWRGKAFRILPKVLEEYPKSRFIFLTLTIDNPPLDDLRSTLDLMHKSWGKLVKRKEFSPVEGWIRSVEVNRAHNDLAHPHYHCLLMVKPSYFSTGYVSQERWTDIWRECLGVSCNPIVDIRVVKPKRGAPEDEQSMAVMAAMLETIKYTTKSSDILRGADREIPGQRVRVSDQDWLVELTKQLHKTRAIATGGVLKKYLKELEAEPEDDKEDWVHINENGLPEEPDSQSPRVMFGWRERAKRYQLED